MQNAMPDHQDDVRGHIWPLIWAVEVAVGVAVVIGWSGPEVPSGPSTGGGAPTPKQPREWTGRMQ